MGLLWFSYPHNGYRPSEHVTRGMTSGPSGKGPHENGVSSMLVVWVHCPQWTWCQEICLAQRKQRQKTKRQKQKTTRGDYRYRERVTKKLQTQLKVLCSYKPPANQWARGRGKGHLPYSGTGSVSRPDTARGTQRGTGKGSWKLKLQLQRKSHLNWFTWNYGQATNSINIEKKVMKKTINLYLCVRNAW